MTYPVILFVFTALHYTMVLNKLLRLRRCQNCISIRKCIYSTRWFSAILVM